MEFFLTKRTDAGRLTLGKWILGKTDDNLINLYVLGQIMGDSDLLSVVIGEIYQRDNWLKITNAAQDELFEGEIIDRNQFMLLRIIDDFNKKTEEIHENAILYSDSIGNLENSITIMIGKHYNPETMGEPFSDEEIRNIISQVREAANI